MTGANWNPNLQPPTPIRNADGSITSGYSHKFDTHLVVTGKNGEERGMVEKDLYDNAFL